MTGRWASLKPDARMTTSKEHLAKMSNVMDDLDWSTLDRTGSGKVAIVDLGRYLRQHGLDVSNFTILRIVCTGKKPEPTIHREGFDEAKDNIRRELATQDPNDLEERQRKFRANYLEAWREHSRSRDESGEIPVSELENVVFSECNPTRELLNTLKQMKSDASESLTFNEFCEVLENLPRSGIIGEDLLLKAFRMEDSEDVGYIEKEQLKRLLMENGDYPLSIEDINEMMEDCGDGDKFLYKDWIQRVVTTKSLSEK